jgi:hypothetical protein
MALSVVVFLCGILPDTRNGSFIELRITGVVVGAVKMGAASLWESSIGEKRMILRVSESYSFW